MKNLIILCGKPGCGKTTLAKKLKEKSGIVHLSLDDFMLNLFGEIEDRKVFEEKLKACRDLVYEITDQLLPKVDVVFDFGFWTKEERDGLRKRFKDFNVIIVYLNLDDETIFGQISKRNKNLKPNEYYIDRETYDFFCSKFEVPDGRYENFIEYKSDGDFSQILKLITSE